MLTFVYFVSAVLLTGSLYLAMHGTYLTGKADDIPEWEFLRNIMSVGIFGGAIIVLIVVWVKMKQEKKKAV